MRTTRLASAATLVLCAALAACGSSGEDESAAPVPRGAAPTTTQPPADDSGADDTGKGAYGTTGTSATAAAQGTMVSAEEDEFHIMLAQTTMPAGTYTFMAHNSGTITHSLRVVGPGVPDVGTGAIAAGGTGSVTVTLQKGTYEVYCPIGDHKMEGMDVKVTVT